MDILCHACGLKICASHSKFCKAEVPLDCDICGKNFKKFDYLKQHKKTHEPNYYECFTCKKKLKSKHNLSIHIKSVHSNLEKLWKCNICNMCFSQKYNLTKHKKLHDEKMFKCDLCLKTFHYNYHLRRHKKSCKYAK